MPTTSNFGWTTPADTDLVKDGALAIRTLGNGIDTSLVDLKGGTTGQVLSKATNTDLDYTWITPNVGDITEVQAGTGISVASGTGPIPVITNTVATAFDAAGDLVYGTGADTFTKLPLGTAGQVLKVNSGATAPEWGAAAAAATFVGCRLTKSADQTISNATNTAITFNGEDFDTDGFHNNVTNNSRITIPSGKDGKYLFTVSGYWADNATGTRTTVLYKNGSIIAKARCIWRREGLGLSAVLSLVATDYIELFVYQDSGGNLDVNDATSIQATFLGA